MLSILLEIDIKAIHVKDIVLHFVLISHASVLDQFDLNST